MALPDQETQPAASLLNIDFIHDGEIISYVNDYINVYTLVHPILFPFVSHENAPLVYMKNVVKAQDESELAASMTPKMAAVEARKFVGSLLDIQPMHVMRSYIDPMLRVLLVNSHVQIYIYILVDGCQCMEATPTSTTCASPSPRSHEVMPPKAG